MSEELQQVEAVQPAPESGDTAVPDAVDNGAPEEAEAPKTFTQEELDAIVSKRLAKEERKWKREQASAAEQQRPATSEPPKPDQFEDVRDYIEAVSDYKAEQKIAQREQQKHQVEVQSTFEERVDEARAKYDDFDRVALEGNHRVTNEMAAAILESEAGPEIAYWLGSNPKESARIASLSPFSQVREIGKLEASLAANPPVKKVSSAPAPIKPVNTRTSTPTYDVNDPRSINTMSASEWINARNKKQAEKYRAR